MLCCQRNLNLTARVNIDNACYRRTSPVARGMSQTVWHVHGQLCLRETVVSQKDGDCLISREELEEVWDKRVAGSKNFGFLLNNICVERSHANAETHFLIFPQGRSAKSAVLSKQASCMGLGSSGILLTQR